MRFIKLFLVIIVLCLTFTSCSHKYSSRLINGTSQFEQTLNSSADMDIELGEPITYTIDVSTPSGRLKLYKLTIDEAKNVALAEAIMAAKCVSIADPKYTFLEKKGQVLRVTVYGQPVKYVKKQK